MSLRSCCCAWESRRDIPLRRSGGCLAICISYGMAEGRGGADRYLQRSHETSSSESVVVLLVCKHWMQSMKVAPAEVE